MGDTPGIKASMRRFAIRSALLVAMMVTVYLALPFLLLTELAKCYPSRDAQLVIGAGYPFLRLASDNAYKKFWLAQLNVYARRGEKNCPDINTRIDAA